MGKCVFCDIVKGAEPASAVYSDEKVLAFLDAQPVNSGHVLIIPKVYAEELTELDEETGGSMFKVALRIASALRHSGLRCEGINLHLADGEAASQDVFHVHLHVIPSSQATASASNSAPIMVTGQTEKSSIRPHEESEKP